MLTVNYFIVSNYNKKKFRADDSGPQLILNSSNILVTSAQFYIIILVSISIYRYEVKCDLDKNQVHITTCLNSKSVLRIDQFVKWVEQVRANIELFEESLLKSAKTNLSITRSYNIITFNFKCLRIERIVPDHVSFDHIHIILYLRKE